MLMGSCCGQRLWARLRPQWVAACRQPRRCIACVTASSRWPCPCALLIIVHCLLLWLQAAALGNLGEAVGGGPLPAPMVHRMCDCLNALAMPLPAAALLQLLHPPDHNGAWPYACSADCPDAPGIARRLTLGIVGTYICVYIYVKVSGQSRMESALQRMHGSSCGLRLLVHARFVFKRGRCLYLGMALSVGRVRELLKNACKRQARCGCCSSRRQAWRWPYRCSCTGRSAYGNCRCWRRWCT